jgi:hypothetical protein
MSRKQTTADRIRAAVKKFRGTRKDPWGRYISTSGRSMDNLFEMGDGDAVVAGLIRLAAADPALGADIRRHGCGMWLEPGYMDRHLAIRKAV